MSAFGRVSQSLATQAQRYEVANRAARSRRIADAIKEIVLGADDSVQRVAGLVAADFAPDSQMVLFTEQGLVNRNGSLHEIYNSSLGRPESTLASRWALLERAGGAADTPETAKAYYAAIHAGAVKIGAAHAGLARAVTADAFSTAALVAAVSDLADQAKDAKAFHDKLIAKK